MKAESDLAISRLYFDFTNWYKQRTPTRFMGDSHIHLFHFK